MNTRIPKLASTEMSKFVLRLPKELREHFRSMADESLRSMNQEMVVALESYAERMNTLDILIKANREMLIRANDSLMSEDNKNVVKLLQTKDHG